MGKIPRFVFSVGPWGWKCLELRNETFPWNSANFFEFPLNLALEFFGNFRGESESTCSQPFRDPTIYEEEFPAFFHYFVEYLNNASKLRPISNASAGQNLDNPPPHPKGSGAAKKMK